MRTLTPEQRQRRNERRREWRRETDNRSTQKYERTKRGKLMRIYRNMKSRVEGVQWRKAHLYAGKPLLPKEEFYEWAMAQQDFHTIYDAWVRYGYPRSLAPSVDRIDPDRGYELENMEWVTMSENSRRSAATRARFKEAA